ncbi:hypothetical protein HPB48_008800 [Haemaphysalis longicornis]|uniref:Exonuclease 1 n=1 Tax=Haemaphysalis longicornis TaxID=44386 RepID=A0A9J6GZ06_HAELO|nr:hypothetical protein HPB48_008800 [Haemaphysalis longicornis]
MAHDVIEECRRRDIDYIVAPYEADAQLAYLAQTKMADVIVTEDSDLIPFGCEKVLFKMDRAGFGQLYERSKLGDCFGAAADRFNTLPKLPSYLKMPSLSVSSQYIEDFLKAENTFRYQLVFCPERKELVPLNPYDPWV